MLNSLLSEQPSVCCYLVCVLRCVWSPVPLPVPYLGQLLSGTEEVCASRVDSGEMCRGECPAWLQLQKERDLMHARAESLDAELQRERSLHRRELRKKAKDMQEVRTTLLCARACMWGMPSNGALCAAMLLLSDAIPWPQSGCHAEVPVHRAFVLLLYSAPGHGGMSKLWIDPLLRVRLGTEVCTGCGQTLFCAS